MDKSSIAETYIEGACAIGAPSSPRTASAPEVDLLNLEVELNSLQEGLDNIHNLQGGLNKHIPMYFLFVNIYYFESNSQSFIISCVYYYSGILGIRESIRDWGIEW
jgi:hypothetical protein